MISKAVCLVNTNQYDSKIYFTNQLAKAMRRAGIETVVIDIKRKWDKELLLKIKLFDPDFTCSFNSFFKTQLNMCPWDISGIPHLMMLLDPAFYSVKFISSPHAFFSTVDYEDCQWFKNNGCQRIFFMPHAVEKELFEEKPQEKLYDVVFMGTMTDFEGFRLTWNRTLPQEQAKVLDDAADLVLSDSKVSLLTALVTVWNSSGLDPKGVDFDTLFLYLDSFTRGKDRYELIKSIKDATVHVFGEPSWINLSDGVGWDTYLGKQKNVIIHPPLEFSKSLEILKKSKICLNSMPFFKYGSHERIFTGLACNALPITMTNLFVTENFEVGKDLLVYQPKAYDSVNEMVNTYLANESAREEIVLHGKEKVLKAHTWDTRVKMMQKEIPVILEQIVPH